jgi:hypothetical protein
METFVPPEFYCPITGALIVEPVSEPSGHTYEKSEILKWLSTNQTSPITRVFLTEADLRENIAMKRSIESLRDKLTEEQLKVDSKIVEKVLVPYISTQEGITLDSYYLNDNLFLKINVPLVEQRAPIDIVLCIDISGSMSNEATLKGNSNETISHGISILSLTVSAAKTILHSLNGDDNVSIVTYSDRAKNLCENISCTPENLIIMETQLDELVTLGCTNIWDGIQMSLDILRTTSPGGKTKGIFLLTDGVPNIIPPRGHESMLERYYQRYDFKCMINCYGFGYSLDSELLMNIANISGSDGFSFIPDASLLGNIFIHGISNFQTTALTNIDMEIILNKDVRFKDGSTKLAFKINSLKYGGEKNYVFSLDTTRCSSTRNDYLNDFAEITMITPSNVIQTVENKRPDINYYTEQKTRIDTISLIDNCIAKKRFDDLSFKDDLNSFIQTLNEIENIKNNTYLTNINFDLHGQIKEALNMTREGEIENWFGKWGIHYLRSLKTAYQNELCNNFKDKGVSNFANELFITIRDEVSDIFDELPPPKSDIKHTRGVTRGGSMLAPTVAPTSMRVYNNSGGGCCAEGSLVLLSDGKFKKVEELEKGDEIFTYDSENKMHFEKSTIECVVKTECYCGKALLSTIDTLKITPYHPIIHYKAFQQEWKFPISFSKPSIVDCNSMYTFVVKNRKSMIIDGFIFSTLNHGLNGDVISHKYFGTENVINDLKKINTYEHGHVLLNKNMFHRGKDNMIYKIE